MSNEHLDRVDQTLNDAGVDRLLADVTAMSITVNGEKFETLDSGERSEPEFETLDSGQRVEFDSGMVRDTDEGKPRYDLIPIAPLRRVAELYERGAKKYGSFNWQNANSVEELQRFKASGLRHYYQYLNGERDEDHAAAVVFNVFAQMWLEAKMADEYPYGFPLASVLAEEEHERRTGQKCA